MDYTDYRSLSAKNSSQNTGAQKNGSYSNYDSFSKNGVSGNSPAANDSPYSRNGLNENESYFNHQAFQKTGVNGNGSSSSYPSNSKTGINGNGSPASHPSYTKEGISGNGSYSAYAAYSQNGTNGGGNAGSRSTYQSQGSSTNGSGTQARNGSSQNVGASGIDSSPKTNYTKVYSSNGNGSSAKKPPYPNGGSGGNGGGKGNGSTPKKPLSSKKSFKQRFLAWLRKFLRSIYMMGKPMRIFVVSAAGFVLVSVVLIIAIAGSKHKKAEVMAAQLALATTPTPTIAATATPVPTPSPTPEIRIEKGAEGEDVMALQKRLMELGYLAIDEPTSYFGNATKEAVKLFQRQHELQQDGICGNDTIVLLNSEEAKEYVMTEGAEGNDIESFQDQLVELGYLESNQVTGYYGTDTVEAVTKFQNRNHLSKDGKAGENTIEKINSADARVSYTKEKEIEAEKKKQAAIARASSPAGRIDKMISIAKKQLGDTYILGKSGPDSFDCSGLVYYCLRQVNVYTRRLNAAGLSKTSSWTKVSDIDNVKAGDLLFFKSDDSSTVGHVGIYVGGGEMIDASSANGKVVRRGAKTSYWRRNFVVARRPIE